MKRILFYCQHVLGMGHLVRSLELARGIHEHEVCFLNGGELTDGIEPPSNIRFVNLPVLKSDEDFHDIHAAPGENAEAVKEQRRTKLLDVLEEFQPDAAVIELFPFGRRKFAFELIPMLDQIRSSHPTTKVACSLRDIVVSKQDRERYERKVRAVMDEYFDLLLVHSDPAFQRLDESFSSAGQIRCPVEYTGFVVRHPEFPREAHRDSDSPRIVVSIGGGRVGCELIEAVIHASTELGRELKHRLEILTGPFLPDSQSSRLAAMASRNRLIALERFTPSLPFRLQQADLSISMAGYNTCMDIIVTGVPALLYPFTGGGNEEQTTRARKMQDLGVAGVLEPPDLDPAKLAGIIRAKLTIKQAKPRVNLNIDGVRRTAELLTNLMDVQ